MCVADVVCYHDTIFICQMPNETNDDDTNVLVFLIVQTTTTIQQNAAQEEAKKILQQAQAMCKSYFKFTLQKTN